MMSSEQNQRKPPPPQKVTFGRRTPSGRYISYSREDLESELGSVDFSNYHVQFPMTPDNQPMELMPVKPAVSAKAEEHYVSSSLFTGGFNSVTRAHLMDKVTNAGGGGPAAKASTCMVEGCDGKVICDERGEELLPCECEFKICRDCFGDAVKNGDKLCPGCKEPYKATDAEEVARIAKERKAITVQRIPAAKAGARMERRLSMMRSIKGGAVGEFDHNRWLFETNGTYGYGNAIMPEEDDEEGCSHGEQRKEFVSKPWRPLTRKLIPAAVLSPYRFNPHAQATHKMTSLIRSNFDTPHKSWKFIPFEVREMWFREFERSFYWLPEYSVRIRKNFEKTGSKRMRDMFTDIRKKGEKPVWIGEHVWDELCKEWRKADYEKMCAQNKQNRSSDSEGFVTSLSTCGSRPLTEYKRLMTAELGREPTLPELHERTHKKKGLMSGLMIGRDMYMMNMHASKSSIASNL